MPPKIGKPTKVDPAAKAAPGTSGQAESADTPPWAAALLAQNDALLKRVTALEAVRAMPGPVNWADEAIRQAATAAPRLYVPEVDATVPVDVRPKAVKATAQNEPQKPPKGVSGSGYTRIPNGKLVRNKRPVARSLPERQAKNWRSTATANLVNALKERGIGPSDPKPVDNVGYQRLVVDLAYAKAYYAYVRESDNPVEVQDWRVENPPPTFSSVVAVDAKSTVPALPDGVFALGNEPIRDNPKLRPDDEAPVGAAGSTPAVASPPRANPVPPKGGEPVVVPPAKAGSVLPFPQEPAGIRQSPRKGGAASGSSA